MNNTRTTYVVNLNELPAITSEKKSQLPRVPENTVHQFDNVYYISRTCRHDRRDQFWRNLANCQWPFKIPQLSVATEGKEPPANFWPQNACVAYNCALSHLELANLALTKKQINLVLEDDVCFKSDFGSKIEEFLQAVPGDWDALMIGGDHCGNKVVSVAPGIDRCFFTYNLHCYTVRGKMLEEFYMAARSPTEPVDYVLARLMSRYKVYCPKPFLAGQRAGFSDICQTVRDEFWGESGIRKVLGTQAGQQFPVRKSGRD